MLMCFIYCALGHSPRGSIAYAGVDVTTGEMVAIIEWSFRLRPQNSKRMTLCDMESDSSDLTNYMKQVMCLSIHWTLASLFLRVSVHVSIFHCLNSKLPCV
jgi:hypothetical protein